MNNLILLMLTLVIALFVARTIGEKIIIIPLLNLVQLAEKISKGNLNARNDMHSVVSEFNVLSHKFNQMAENLQKNNEELSKLSLRV